MMEGNVSKVGSWALDSWMFKNYEPKERPIVEQLNDGIIFSQDGRVLAQASPLDTVYAMKEGGPLLTTLAAGFESNGKILINLHEMHADHMATQIELDEERNSLLLELGQMLYKSLNPDAATTGGGGMGDTFAFTGASIADGRAMPTAPV